MFRLPPSRSLPPPTRLSAPGVASRDGLEGARGAAGVSKPALVELILKVASIVEAHPEIAEIDLNTLMAYPDGYAVVDARMILDRIG